MLIDINNSQKINLFYGRLMYMFSHDHEIFLEKIKLDKKSTNQEILYESNESEILNITSKYIHPVTFYNDDYILLSNF